LIIATILLFSSTPISDISSIVSGSKFSIKLFIWASLFIGINTSSPLASKDFNSSSNSLYVNSEKPDNFLSLNWDIKSFILSKLKPLTAKVELNISSTFLASL